MNKVEIWVEFDNLDKNVTNCVSVRRVTYDDWWDPALTHTLLYVLSLRDVLNN